VGETDSILLEETRQNLLTERATAFVERRQSAYSTFRFASWALQFPGLWHSVRMQQPLRCM